MKDTTINNCYFHHNFGNNLFEIVFAAKNLF